MFGKWAKIGYCTELPAKSYWQTTIAITSGLFTDFGNGSAKSVES